MSESHLRRVLALAGGDTTVYALLDDSTVWVFQSGAQNWIELPSIPRTRPSPPSLRAVVSASSQPPPQPFRPY